MKILRPIATVGALGLVLMPCAVLRAQQTDTQHKPLVETAPTTPHRTRLIMKDGSYQIVMSYRIVGSMVRYISAERGGEEEDVPLALVDLDATHKWEQRQAARLGRSPDLSPDGVGPPAIDPELLKEEADRAALTPEIAKDLRLPEDDSTLALDTFHGTPELVPLAQTDSDLNRNTAHNVLRASVNPQSSAHPIVQLKGEGSPVQLHVSDPVLYIRVGDDTVGNTSGAAMTVDTHGASSRSKDEPTGGSQTSRYVIVRAEVRRGIRVISSFRIGLLGSGQRQEDVVETTTELLPGGHWMKITPAHPLDFGEFALMEVISDKAVNVGVWDFGVHPVAPENRDVLKPEPKRRVTLERHGPDSD